MELCSLRAIYLRPNYGNRLTGLDLIDRAPDELWMELSDTVEETGIKAILRKRNAKKQNGCTKKDLNDPDNHDGVPRTRHPGVCTEVGLTKHYYEQS